MSTNEGETKASNSNAITMSIATSSETSTSRVTSSAPIVSSKALTTSSSRRSGLNSGTGQFPGRYSRLFKKSSQDGQLVLFLPSRELVIGLQKTQPLTGVALVKKELVEEQKERLLIHVQLTFRYGREDEELMGLRFCNEIVVAADQLLPLSTRSWVNDSSLVISEHVKSANATFEPHEDVMPDFLAVPFVLHLGHALPPSVRLVPSRPYSGASIGTSYEVHLYTLGEQEQSPKKRRVITMTLRLLEETRPMSLIGTPRNSLELAAERHFVFSDHPLTLRACINRDVLKEGDVITVSVRASRACGLGASKLKVLAVQQVGVAMFSSGNFRNIVGSASQALDGSETEIDRQLSLTLGLTSKFSWAAMEQTPKKQSDANKLAPTVVHGVQDGAVFVVRVHYYVQVVLYFSRIQSPLTLKIPFVLLRANE